MQVNITKGKVIIFKRILNITVKSQPIHGLFLDDGDIPGVNSF